MRRQIQIVFLLAVLAPGASTGEVIERIVGRVGHHVILQSELDDALRYQALVAGREPGSFSLEERKETLDRLVDQLLIQGQMDRSTFVHVAMEAIDRQVREIRRQIAGAETDDSWRALLERYGLTETDVRNRVAEQLDILRYVDARFRTNIHIDKRSIENYYQEQFLSQLRKTGARDIPLKEVSDRIEEILIQQRMNELTSAWLQNLRTQEEVQLQ